MEENCLVNGVSGQSILFPIIFYNTAGSVRLNPLQLGACDFCMFPSIRVGSVAWNGLSYIFSDQQGALLFFQNCSMNHYVLSFVAGAMTTDPISSEGTSVKIFGTILSHQFTLQ